MALFARTANWTYDQPLLRAAGDEEDRLEAMMAALAMDDQAIWVVESNEIPVAFAWATLEENAIQILRLFSLPCETPLETLRTLVARIDEEGENPTLLEAANETVDGFPDAALEAAGFRRQGTCWTRSPNS